MGAVYDAQKKNEKYKHTYTENNLFSLNSNDSYHQKNAVILYPTEKDQLAY